MKDLLSFCKKNIGHMFFEVVCLLFIFFPGVSFGSGVVCCFSNGVCSTWYETCQGESVDCSDPKCSTAECCSDGCTPYSAVSCAGSKVKCSDCTSGETSTEMPKFFNPIEYDSLEGEQGLVKALTNNLYSFVVGLTIIFIVLGGIFYMFSTGNPGMVARAKNSWLFALVGFAIVVAAPTFLDSIIEILQVQANSVSAGADKTLAEIITATVNLLLSLLGLLCIIGLTVSGGMYLTAYGKDDQINTAKKIAKYSIIGLVVALSSLIVIEGVEYLIGNGPF